VLIDGRSLQDGIAATRAADPTGISDLHFSLANLRQRVREASRVSAAGPRRATSRPRNGEIGYRRF
jgi:hypothetical protein